MQLVGRFYQDYRCDLAEEEEYLTWFQDRGFDFDTFTDLEAGLLADSLISTATGANLQTNISLKEMQGAMLRLMAQLSSYSIQFLQSINTQPIKVIDWPTIRVGDQHIKGMSHVKVDAIDVRVQDVGESGRTKLYFDLDQIGTDLTHTFKTFAFDRIDFNLDIFDRIRPRFKNRALIADLGVRNFATSLPPPPPPSFPDGNPYVPPETSPLHHAFRAFQSPHYFLTTANRLTIIDRWDQWLDSIAQPEIVLLEGIDYPLPPPVELDGIEAPLPPPVILDGIDYPVESLGLGGLDYPPTILDGLDYPPGP